MFGSKKSTFLQVKNILSESTVVTGDIAFDGNTKIDGKITGSISCSGDVIIGEAGKVNGSISAENVIISGGVTGNIAAEKQFCITATGVLNGDVEAASLVIDEGAEFNGMSKSKKKSEPAEDGEADND